ncbi:uncharacterized protein SAPINGB_P004166 [Magnusiomyces paraingens]|uniref:mannose-1-phosphate guanylyltransferase n=1 Tax=Magnusiomyces paraingens TaxID=2606893 RepID=A0A5E8BVG6_9ASCO|nr:uncharacterized protein SAPINGB_P004166 [Saprochaete ingens]VVT54619.1 unnamed protein product [Saprochaete ingens]
MPSKALILVGGGTRGTRFRPLSLDIPKVLFPVAGKPIVSHAIDAIAGIDSIKEILLIGFYDDAVFKDFIADSQKQYPGISIKYLREYKAMGTAGGLYHFRDEILKGNPSKFFVIHADVCCSFPLKEIDTLYLEKQAKAVILGTRVHKDEARNYGCIVAEPKTGRVLHYVEKPESKVSNLINAGVYLFDKTIFDTIAEAKTARDEASASRFGDDDQDVLRLEQDVLVRLPQTGSFYVYETKDFWLQIKTAGSAVPANSLYLQKLFQANPSAPGLRAPSATIVPPVFVDPSAQVDDSAKLGPNVSIGPNAKIGAGARVRDSIVLGGVELKHDSVVLNSIVSSDSKVGAWARVEGTGHHTPASGAPDGVTILASNVSVADEVHVQNVLVLPHKEIKTDVKNEVIM